MRVIQFVALAAILMSTGCASETRKNRNKISTGMTKAEVIETLGEPDSIGAAQGKEALKYKSNPLIGTRQFCVVLENNHVQEYGEQTCAWW